MDSGKLFLGVLVGLAAGATLGILFAPDKGSNTQKKISNKAKRYTNEIEDKYNEVVDGINHKVDNLKEEAGHYFESGKAKAKEAEEKALAFGNGK